MHMHLLCVQTLRLCRRARDSCNGGLHLLPIHRAERFPQAMFRRLPTWLSSRDLPLPRFRQAKHTLALIFSRPDVDPPLLAQQGQRTCKRSAVHGKTGTQRFLVGLADNGEGGEQAELGDFDSGLAELLVVNAGHKSGDTPKVLTGARKSKERVRGMIVVNRHNNKMYIHVLLLSVKDDSPRIVDQLRVNVAAKALKSAWTSIAGKRLSLLCLSSPENSPSTKAAPAVIEFTSRWISPNKRATTIAASESEVPKNESVAGN